MIRLTAFTLRGVELALHICSALGEGEVWTLPKFQREGVRCYRALSDWTEEQFAQKYDLIFVGATGIAVRSIAPHVRDKWSDPAVLSVDELGCYVIPLLSGHAGGANRLARRLAALMGAQPVITTATDLNQLFAVDEWAVRQGIPVTDPEAAKAISAALLEGEEVGFASELPHGPLPDGVRERPARPDFALTCRAGERFPAGTLVLHPRLLTVGIGCRRGTGVEELEAAVCAVLTEHGLARESVAAFASIDLKRSEAGLHALAERWAVPLSFYSAGELADLPGVFTASEFVRSVTGVDNVCERSALLCAEGGQLLAFKTALDGVTVAVARRPCFYEFLDEEELLCHPAPTT